MTKRLIALAAGVSALLSMPAPSFAAPVPTHGAAMKAALPDAIAGVQARPAAPFAPVPGDPRCRFIGPYQGWGCPAYSWGAPYWPGGPYAPGPLFPGMGPRPR